MEQDYKWTWIEAQVEESIEAWNGCALRFPPSMPRYSLKEQRAHEKACDQGMRTAEREARRVPRSLPERERAAQRMVELFPRFAAAVLDFDQETVDLLTNKFFPVGKEFARWARIFDPILSLTDTVQACRNAWIACGMQELLGRPMELTPSILAYSMLYPYSDNYLDDPAITQTDKLTFNERFRQRLCGQRIAAVNTHETSIWSMVQMIEEQYPRQRYPQVYESLLAIHRSQGESIAQLNHGAGINHSSNLDEVLRISCAKGGSSVLADACIAQPWLTPEESRFSFEWGVLLQLGDDLQDVREDLERGSLTLFTRAVQQGIPLDSLVRQLLHFSDRVANRMDNLANGTDALKDLLRMSWRTLILMAVADAQQFCSREFLAELEPCSLFHFDFLRARNKKLVGREALFATLFDAFVKAGEVETGQDDQAGVSLPDGIRKAIPIPAVFADRGQFAHPLPAFSSLTA